MIKYSFLHLLLPSSCLKHGSSQMVYHCFLQALKEMKENKWNTYCSHVPFHRDPCATADRLSFIGSSRPEEVG